MYASKLVSSAYQVVYIIQWLLGLNSLTQSMQLWRVGFARTQPNPNSDLITQILNFVFQILKQSISAKKLIKIKIEYHINSWRFFLPTSSSTTQIQSITSSSIILVPIAKHNWLSPSCLHNIKTIKRAKKGSIQMFEMLCQTPS